LGIPKRSVWHLQANCWDDLQIRNVFNFDLWQYAAQSVPSLKMESYVKYNFVELFVDGEYVGLYTLGHPINKKTLELIKGDSLFKKEKLVLDSAK